MIPKGTILPGEFDRAELMMDYVMYCVQIEITKSSLVEMGAKILPLLEKKDVTRSERMMVHGITDILKHAQAYEQKLAAFGLLMAESETVDTTEDMGELMVKMKKIVKDMKEGVTE